MSSELIRHAIDIVTEATTSKAADINNLSQNQQIAAIKRNPRNLLKINNPSEQVELAAVRYHPLYIKHIKNPSEAVQLAAIHANLRSLKNIKNPTEAVQMAAVKDYAYALKYIENPSPAVQSAAVQNNYQVILQIKRPEIDDTPKLKERVLKQILIAIKEDDLDLKAYKKLRKIYSEWPEWALIDRSLRADGKKV